MANTEKFIFSSESVTEGHPDKVADQISDGILDAILKDDPNGRVACEVLCTTGLVMVSGEITTRTYVDIPKLARGIVQDIGYTRAKYGFDGETCAVLTAIDEQSGDIAQGVDNAIEVRDKQEKKLSEEEIARIGAGDQGMMFGYACALGHFGLDVPHPVGGIGRCHTEVPDDETGIDQAEDARDTHDQDLGDDCGSHRRPAGTPTTILAAATYRAAAATGVERPA